MGPPTGGESHAPELLDETVRRALELVTGELVEFAEPTPSDIQSAFDAAQVGVFGHLVARFAAARRRDGPPFATGDELRAERARFESLSAAASERLDALLASPEYGSLSFRQVSGAYERSLDYEPEIADGDVRITGDASRRAAVGAYYTPDAVVEYAVSRALDGETDAKIIDPAMGSGNFLTCAIDRLAEARDEPPARARRFVAESLIFGVDIDPLAVELARSAVWLETGVWQDETLRVGDALAAESELFENGAFDAVVGNPPYVRSRHIPTERKTDLRERFETVIGAFDLYVAFIERMAELGGRVSCVVPNKWTTARYGRALRDTLLDRHRLLDVLDVSNASVFADASVYPLVLTFQADDGPTDSISIRQGESEETREETTLSRSFVDGLGGRVIPVGIDPAFAPLAERLGREFDTLGSHVTQTEGIHTGNVREKLVVNEPGPDCEKLVGGSDVSRYQSEWNGDWIRFDPSLIEEGEYGSLRGRSTFETNKLLLCDISERPMATYDDEGLYALNTLYSVRSRPCSELPLRYILGIVNSSVAACWFQQVYGGTHVSGGYLRFKPMFATQLPVPDGTSERDELVALTERMETFRAARNDFEVGMPESPDGPRLGDLTRRVETDSPVSETATARAGLRLGTVTVEKWAERLDFRATARYRPAEQCETDSWGFAETDPVRVLVFDAESAEGGALGRWYDVLPWYVPRRVAADEFTREARKTISPLDRLESVRLPAFDDATAFAERCRSAARLDAEIERTDAAIDRLVYRAYGLSNEEIDLVERLVE